MFVKYDGAPHRLVEAVRLGEDAHGLWVGSAPGTRGQRADGSWTTIDHHRVRLFPRGQWWSALFNDTAHRTAIYCDITMPAEFGVDSVTLVDLDLDIRLLRDGTVHVMDEDEFEAHQVRYNYPPQVVATARATCNHLAHAITTAEPFTTAYKPYLELARSL
jgi:protein associated with RNAse G/E